MKLFSSNLKMFTIIKLMLDHSPCTSRSKFFSVSPARLLATQVYRAVSATSAPYIISSLPSSSTIILSPMSSGVNSCPFLYHVIWGGGMASAGQCSFTVPSLTIWGFSGMVLVPSGSMLPSLSMNLGGTETSCSHELRYSLSNLVIA